MTIKSKKITVTELRKIIKEELSEAKPTHYDGIRIPDAADLSNKAIELTTQAIQAYKKAAKTFMVEHDEASRQGDVEHARYCKEMKIRHENMADNLQKVLADFKAI